MNKNQMSSTHKSSMRKKQDDVLDKKKIDIDFPSFQIQERIVGVNKNVLLAVVLFGSLLFNWKLFKSVEQLSAEVSKIRETKVSLEVKHHGSETIEGQQRYLDNKLGQMKQEILNSIEKERSRVAIGEQNFANRDVVGKGALVPSAIELIDQIDIGQYTVVDSDQYGSLRELLRSLSRMRYKYRKEIQEVVSAYSNSHAISGVDGYEYAMLLEKRSVAFEKLEFMHEKVKNEWKMKNKVAINN